MGRDIVHDPLQSAFEALVSEPGHVGLHQLAVEVEEDTGTAPFHEAVLDEIFHPPPYPGEAVAQTGRGHVGHSGEYLVNQHPGLILDSPETARTAPGGKRHREPGHAVEQPGVARYVGAVKQEPVEQPFLT